MTNLEKFISSTLSSCIPKKEYTPQEVIKKLDTEITMLQQQLFYNSYSATTFREKSQLLRDKIEQREQIKSENNI